MSRDGWGDWYRNREKRRHAVKPSAGKVAAAIDFYRPAGTPSVAIGDLTVIDEAGPFDPFVALCVADGLPEPCREYPFHPDRRWRFDYAWPRFLVAVEKEGGLGHARGGLTTPAAFAHASADGILRDMEKGNAAVQLGWRLLRFTPQQLLAGAVAQIAELLR